MSTSPSHAASKTPSGGSHHDSAGAPKHSHDHGHDISKHLKVYVGVFVALLVGTGITVWLHYVHLESFALTVAIALLVASVKGFLVAGYFMHLMTEKKMIYAIMASTAFFFIGLMGLLVWSYSQTPKGTIHYGPLSTRHAPQKHLTPQPHPTP